MRQNRGPGVTGFCVGAAWRAPKDRAIEKVAELVETVKSLRLETCHNLDGAPEFCGDIISTREYQDRLDTPPRARGTGLT